MCTTLNALAIELFHILGREGVPAVVWATEDGAGIVAAIGSSATFDDFARAEAIGTKFATTHGVPVDVR